jgi:hypothetical protein
MCRARQASPESLKVATSIRLHFDYIRTPSHTQNARTRPGAHLPLRPRNFAAIDSGTEAGFAGASLATGASGAGPFLPRHISYQLRV